MTQQLEPAFQELRAEIISPPIPPMDGNHMILFAEPNRELTLQTNLMIRRVPFYFPTIFRAARISARQHALGGDHPDIPIALFPRVFLIAEDVIGKMYDLIRNAPGLMSQPFMKFGDQYAIMRPLDMQIVRGIEIDERDRYWRKKLHKFAPAYVPKLGETVSVLLDEVLGGLRGKVAEVDDKGRITLLTEIMKRTVRVKLTANQIEPV